MTMAGRLKGRSSIETRSAILDLIRSSGRVSRIELAEKSGLTEATISKIVRGLLDDGLVVEAGYADSTGGKRPVLLELNSESRYAIGISLDARRIVYVVSDITGHPVHRMTSDGIGSTAPPEVMKRVAKELARLLRRASIERADIIGIGVAGAGRLDSSGGVLRSSRQASDWERFAIEETLRDATGLPVILENDAKCAALGEFWLGRVPASRDFATVYMANGIGCGLVVHGDVYRGASSNAGEIGHMVLDVNGPECFCGAHGCLETLATPASVARKALASPELSDRLELEQDEPDVRVTFTAVAKAAMAGDADAAALIQEAADYLATAVLGLTNIFDLDLIYLAGPGFADAGPIYLDTTRDVLARLAFMRSVHPIDVEMSDVGPESSALGAASVVLHSHLTPHHGSARAPR
jgi:predicted NBD/HSP70 family sugar kinase